MYRTPENSSAHLENDAIQSPQIPIYQKLFLTIIFQCTGLTYLHSFATRCIIHRDVKSSNILLDHSMCAKVADFGFSKYAPQEGDSGVSLEVRGTAGYLDPE